MFARSTAGTALLDYNWGAFQNEMRDDLFTRRDLNTLTTCEKIDRPFIGSPRQTQSWGNKIYMYLCNVPKHSAGRLYLFCNNSSSTPGAGNNLEGWLWLGSTCLAQGRRLSFYSIFTRASAVQSTREGRWWQLFRTWLLSRSYIVNWMGAWIGRSIGIYGDDGGEVLLATLRHDVQPDNKPSDRPVATKQLNATQFA